MFAHFFLKIGTKKVRFPETKKILKVEFDAQTGKKGENFATNEPRCIFGKNTIDYNTKNYNARLLLPFSDAIRVSNGVHLAYL